MTLYAFHCGAIAILRLLHVGRVHRTGRMCPQRFRIDARKLQNILPTQISQYGGLLPFFLRSVDPNIHKHLWTHLCISNVHTKVWWQHPKR